MSHSQNLNKSTSGVPQVGIWSPTLFKMYISEINFLLKNVKILTYANDITVTVSHTNHHLSQTIYSRIFLQSITLFALDLVEYGTTQQQNIQKLFIITFDPKLTFPQYVIDLVPIQNLLAPFCCVLGKDTFRHFSLLGGLGKQL